ASRRARRFLRVGRGTKSPSEFLAFVKAAGEALLAAFLVHEGRLPALLAEIADRLLGGRRRLRALGRLDLTDVLGEAARQRVRQRQHLRGAEAHRLGA